MCAICVWFQSKVSKKMNDHPQISVAVIGCGHWGKNLVRNFSELGALKAISDPNPATQKTMHETYNVPAREVDDILADNTIDAVVIAVPAELHHDVALKALQAGKHVFVEKPITLTMEHAQELCTAAQQHSKTLMVGHLLQYHPAFLKLKELVREGALGGIRYIYSRRLSIGKLRVHENVLWSFAPHDISMILALAGQAPDQVVGFSGNFLQPEIGDFASVQMAFPNGAKAHVEVSWLNPFKEQRLVVVGETGMIVFDDQADWPQKLVMYRHRAEIVDGEPVLEKAEAEPVDVEPGEPLRNECMHFLRFCQTGETPYTDGQEAMAVLKVLRAGDAGSKGWTDGVNS